MIYIFLVLIFLGLVINRPKIFGPMIIIFLGIWINQSINLGKMADFYSYQNIYNQIALGINNENYQTGNGWYVLNKVGQSLNLNYAQFKIYISILCLIVIALILKYWIGANYNYFWSVYLIYPALIEMVQTRFFVATTIVFLGLMFLYHNKLWSNIIFVIMILISTTIHAAASFYLVFLLVPILNKNIKIFRRVFVVLVVLLVCFGNRLQNIITIFANTRELDYFNGRPSLGHLLIFICIVLAFYFITQKLNRIIQKDSTIVEKEKKISNFITNINTCMLLLIPILPLAFDFMRVQRIAWLLLYVQFLILIKNKKYIKFNDYKCSYKIMLWGVSVLGFALMICYFNPAVLTSFF